MKGTSRYAPFLAFTVVIIISLAVAGCTTTPASTLPPGMLNGTENAVIIKNFAFSPQTLSIRAGSSVTWVNQDTVNHTVVSDPGAPSAFESRNLSFGGSYSFTFSKAGTYPYHCSIHPSMTGTITVIPR